MKVLFTGSRGYLCRSLVRQMNHHEITYHDNLNSRMFYVDIDIIAHFAGPSDDYDFKDERRVMSSIIKGTKNVLNIARSTGAHFIFASTKGVEKPNNLYTCCKFVMEKYIQTHYTNYCILRIPRIYSSCRNKGLMKKIRLNDIPKEHMQKTVSFLELQDFVAQTLPVFDNKQSGIHEYNGLKTKTINEIKKLYC